MRVLARENGIWQQLLADAHGHWREEDQSPSLGALVAALLALHGLTADIFITHRQVRELPDNAADLRVAAQDVFIAVPVGAGGDWKVLFHDRAGTAQPEVVAQLSAGALLAQLKNMAPQMDARPVVNNEVLIVSTISWNELQQDNQPAPTLH